MSSAILCGPDTVGEAPDGLMVEFLQGPAVIGVADREPEFGWITHSPRPNDVQTAYRILVSTSLASLEKKQGDMWDSGKVDSASSINVSYGGKSLAPRQTCYWTVKTWRSLGGESPWAAPQKFTMDGFLDGYCTSRYPLCQTEISPRKILKKNPGRYLIDFGKVAFGYLKLNLPQPTAQLEVHFGERGDDCGINRKPGGSVRYYRVVLDANAQPEEDGCFYVHPPRDRRNTGADAVLLPAEIGTVAPFRFVEIVNGPANLTASMIRQVAVHYPFDEEASSFQSSSRVLDNVWALCKYSMKATSFAGVYSAGDRERIPYEADSYINQLSHYATDREYTLARYSHEYSLRHPTWPTEWKHHSVFMAWADYMYTGDKESLIQNYRILKSKKTLEQYARSDGLLNTDGLKDIVDWPAVERDNFDFRAVNTVVNAFYYRTLVEMVDLANAIGQKRDAAEYRKKAAQVKLAFNEVFFDPQRGVYVDGEGSKHASLHANMMPLAFDLVPEKRMDRVADYVVSRGMACSVYGAQYLLEALYHAGRDEVALERMTSKGLRSWYNMLRVGSTITLEAWDDRFKPNQDWNHGWGAAPANIISRYVLGVRPLEPGFRKVLIRPQPGTLRSASGTIPTIRGPIKVSLKNERGKTFILNVDIPVNVTAKVGLPYRGNPSPTITLDGKDLKVTSHEGSYFVDGIGSGSHVLICH
ncbi:MAG: rhamnosidase [Pirellulales bacterium]|nr:rhamnosidase [Pirellulales bacterium]